MNPGVAMAGELVLLVRARLAAGEPIEDVVDWLVTEKGWSKGPSTLSKGASTWVKEVSLLPRPTFEHPNVTKTLREKLGQTFGTCGTCGAETGEDGTRCNLCWEVEHRLSRYLESNNGRAFVSAALEQGEPVEEAVEIAGPLAKAAASLIASHVDGHIVVGALVEFISSGRRVPRDVAAVLAVRLYDAVKKAKEVLL